MMSSGSHMAWMEARNIEDVLDGHEPDDWVDPNTPIGPSQAYGDFSDDWIDASQDMPVPEDEYDLHTFVGLRPVVWCAAYLGDLEIRMTGGFA
jgi:hypothetical protein